MLRSQLATVACVLAGGTLFASEPSNEWARLEMEGRRLVAAAKYAEAEPIFRSALAVLSAGPPDPRRLGITWNDLGVALTDLGRLQEAEAAIKRAIDLLGAAEDALSTQFAAVSNLAGVYKRMGKYKAAERLFRESLRACEQGFGPTDQRCTTVLNNLADLLNIEGLFAQAVPLLRRAIAIEEAQFGPDHPGLAFLLDNIALAYSGLGSFETAEPLFRRALAIRLRNPGPNHPDTARIEVRLGGTLAKLGRFQEATALAEQGLRTAEEALGPENDQLGLILNYLGIVYAEQGRYSDAESAFRRAIRISARLGDAHPEHLVGLQNYAALLRLMHRNKEAGRIEAQLRRALALTEGADFRKATVSVDSLRRGR